MVETQETRNYHRFCPGEERVKISNAICLGRRRSHFPKCHGCQFNDAVQEPVGPQHSGRSTLGHARHATSAGGDTPPASTIQSLFHDSDISGVVPDPLSADAAWRIGHAAAQFLRSKLRGYDRADPDARSVIVGRDAREHARPLADALIEGIRSTGTDVVDLGVVDTPMLYFAVDHLRACGGIQVSGGDRPLGENGLRICGAKAIPVGIDTGLGSVRDIAARIPRHETGASPRLTHGDVSPAYAEFVRGFLLGSNRLPRPIKIVVDANNGTAGRWIPVLFKGIRNLRMTRLNFEHKGKFAHGPDPLDARNTRELRQTVKAEEADFGICFDSSAERCVFVDDHGRTIRPDYATALLAKAFIAEKPGVAIVYDYRAGIATEEEIVRNGGIPVREQPCGAFIKRTLSERGAVFGGDLTGAYYFRDALCCESATLAFVHMINLLLKSGRRLSELVRPIQRYSSSGDIRFQCEDTDRAVADVIEAHGEATVEQFDGVTFRYPDWWFNVRTLTPDHLLSVTLEARSRKLVEQRLSELEAHLGTRA